MNMKLPALGWAMSPQIIAASALVVGDVWNFNSAMMPSYFTIRTFVSKGMGEASDTKHDIYVGMAAAGVMSLLTGLAVSVVFKSWWPFAFAAGGLVAADAMYLHAMMNPHGRYDSIASQ
jgi:hypothetical protein